MRWNCKACKNHCMVDVDGEEEPSVCVMMVTKESKGLLRGEYGQNPAPVNEEVRAKAGIAPEDVITGRPADLIAPEMDKYREETKEYAKSEEDVLDCAMFPQVAPKFFDKRNAKKQGVDGDHVDYTNQSHPV